MKKIRSNVKAKQVMRHGVKKHFLKEKTLKICFVYFKKGRYQEEVVVEIACDILTTAHSFRSYFSEWQHFLIWLVHFTLKILFREKVKILIYKYSVFGLSLQREKHIVYI